MDQKIKPRKGIFITLEGGEGSGKTTLLQKLGFLLAQKNYEVLTTRAPGGTSLGVSIREILLHQKTHFLAKKGELFLFLADRAQHTQEVILPALNSGKIVLCDRFNDSTLAYQGAAREENLKFIEQLCDYVTDGLKPHLTIYLDLDPLIGLKRAKQAITSQGKATYDRLESETVEFHQRVRECYLALAKKHRERFLVISADQTLEQVLSQAIDYIVKFFSL